MNKLLALFLSTTISTIFQAAPLKPRMVVLTDVPTWETDDSQSYKRSTPFHSHVGWGKYFEWGKGPNANAGEIDNMTPACHSDVKKPGAPTQGETLTKPRVIVTADFPPLDVIPGGAGHGPAEKRSDPDDVQSMVRFLLYANEFDVEGLVSSSATFANVANKTNILDILDLYDQIDENLRRRDPRYPTADQLRSVTWEGHSESWGKPADEILGEGKDSEASEAIIRVVD